MHTIEPSFVPANKFQEQYGEKDGRFQKRFEALKSDMQHYIDKSGFSTKVTINNLVLGCALLDYFEDIRRLKEFHQIPHVNSIKIMSYLSYWLLRRKPLQILEPDINTVYANERFVLSLILEFLGDDYDSVLMRPEKGIDVFIESLLYYFKYRQYNAQDIEMIVIAFFAGRVYQSREIDISNQLPPSDHAAELARDGVTSDVESE